MAKKRYLVTGSLPVADTQPGEEFSAEFQRHEEEALMASGAIALAPKPASQPKEK